MEYILICGSGICGVVDILHRKIPNIITFPLLFIAFGINTYKGRFKMALIGFLIAFLIGFVGFILGQIGAGDVKLMSALGAGFGLRNLAHILLISSIVGITYIAVVYLIKVSREGKIKERIKRGIFLIINYNILEENLLQSFLKRKYKYPIPFGACLFVGVVIVNLFL